MVAVRVHIDNPDENIFLGIDAKVKILTASEKGVLQAPVEAVNVDSQGSFCYVIDNGILVKKYVTTGISSETYIQIKDGLKENQEIVTTSVYGMGLEEGMMVTGIPMAGAAKTDALTEENDAATQESMENATEQTQENAEDASTVTQENTEDQTDNG